MHTYENITDHVWMFNFKFTFQTGLDSVDVAQVSETDLGVLPAYTRFKPVLNYKAKHKGSQIM
jgi:hypothetical protein